MSEELKSEVPEKKPCWYVVHTYSGYEKKVQETLQKSVENSPEMQKLIFRVEVPVEDVESYREILDRRAIMNFLRSKTTVVAPAAQEGATTAEAAPEEAAQ